ncbi:hypothetical protein S83_039057 [Arachis hypogaea]
MFCATPVLGKCNRARTNIGVNIVRKWSLMVLSNIYRLNLILTDGTGCIKVILWNSKAKAIVGKTTSKIKEASETNQGSCYAKALNAIIENKFLFKLSVTSRNIRSVDQAYNVVKLRDDESLIDLYGMQSLSIDNGSVSTLLGGSCNLETYSERNVLGNVSLSKHIRQLTQDSTTESFCKTGNATPTKPTGPAVVGNSAIVGVGSPEGQGSSKKIFRKGSGKWKME